MILYCFHCLNENNRNIMFFESSFYFKIDLKKCFVFLLIRSVSIERKNPVGSDGDIFVIQSNCYKLKKHFYSELKRS